MKNNSLLLKFCGILTAAWFSLCIIFPHVSSITFTGGSITGLGLALVSVLADSLILGSCFFLGSLGLLVYVIVSQPDLTLLRKSIIDFFLKLGYWRWVAIGTAFHLVIGGFAWKFVAAFSSSLHFAGFFTSFAAAAIVTFVFNVPAMLINPTHYSGAYYRKTLTEFAEKHSGAYYYRKYLTEFAGKSKQN